MSSLKDRKSSRTEKLGPQAVVIGRLVGIGANGSPVVAFPGNPAGTLRFRHESMLGRPRCVLLFLRPLTDCLLSLYRAINDYFEQLQSLSRRSRGVDVNGNVEQRQTCARKLRDSVWGSLDTIGNRSRGRGAEHVVRADATA